MIDPRVDPDLVWFDQPVSTIDLVPHQWFYKEEPCNLIAVAYRGTSMLPCVMRVETFEYGVIDVWAAETGEFPDLGYRVYEHEAGNA